MGSNLEGLSKSSTLHVPLEKLDVLLNLAGELSMTRSSIVENGRTARRKHGLNGQIASFLESSERIGRISKEIQRLVTKSRLVPVSRVLERYREYVENDSNHSGKKVEFVVRGGGTEVDKKVIDSLAEPLVHLVRNAVDHGIETTEKRLASGKRGCGTISLVASLDAHQLVISVQDDGAGVDVKAVQEKVVARGLVAPDKAEPFTMQDAIEWLFQPGFSTADALTEVSGRGVGMDVVRRKVQRLGGSVTGRAIEGQGSTFTIRLPIAMSVLDVLLLDVRGEIYAMPIEHVEETIRIRREDISFVDGCEVIAYRGESLIVRHLCEFIGGEGSAGSEFLYLVVVDDGQSRIGLSVDQVKGRQEIVIKPLTGRVSGIRGFGGAAIANDGSVILVLDVCGFHQTSAKDEKEH